MKHICAQSAVSTWLIALDVLCRPHRAPAARSGPQGERCRAQRRRIHGCQRGQPCLQIQLSVAGASLTCRCLAWPSACTVVPALPFAVQADQLAGTGPHSAESRHRLGLIICGILAPATSCIPGHASFTAVQAGRLRFRPRQQVRTRVWSSWAAVASGLGLAAWLGLPCLRQCSL